jgi:hypothetical protein
MERNPLPQANARQMAGLSFVALVSSALTALVIVFALSKRRQAVVERAALERAESEPTQPAINTVTPTGVPDHFTEDLVVPGLTFTGAQIEDQDEKLGRSPEGV